MRIVVLFQAMTPDPAQWLQRVVFDPVASSKTDTKVFFDFLTKILQRQTIH
jgi:hypothetical protein